MMKNQRTELSMLGTPLNEDVLSQVTGGNTFTEDQLREIKNTMRGNLEGNMRYTDAVGSNLGLSVKARVASAVALSATLFVGDQAGKALVNKLRGKK